ncbi:MAG: helix-turn-helix domain-containing protein [Clostridia bacterium]|nr:helix-turn-helix domain-containing protein [Clostridia bacterium]
MSKNKPIIAERIKQLRKEKSLTQEQLADILGLNAKSSIANYESGANSPSDEIKKKMCKEFDCSMDYLMGLTSHKNPKEELEKELYKLDLTENQFNQMISLLLDEDNDKIDILFSKKNNKLTKACQICLEFAWDYTIPINEDLTDEQKEKINELETENVNKVINIIKSLDKSKIIHNYNIEQEFKYAYHKEMEGLTEEEITDALRFYKKIKYGDKDNK